MPKKEYKRHKSWGVCGLHRVYGGGIPGKEMFGSDVTNSAWIVLTIKQASKQRDLGRDWVFGEETVCQVELSSNQFAEMLTNMNVGDGVPCTISFTQKDGHIQYQPEDRKLDVIQLDREQEDTDMINALSDAYTILQDLYSSNKMPKTVGGEALGKISRALSHFKNGGSDFLRRQAKEEIESMVVQAKTQVSDYVNAKIYSVGLEKLMNSNDIKPELLSGQEIAEED